MMTPMPLMHIVTFDEAPMTKEVSFRSVDPEHTTHACRMALGHVAIAAG